MHLHEIRIHLFHIAIHVEQNRRLFFLSIIIGRAAACSCAPLLKFFKDTTTRFSIDIVSQSKSIEILFLHKIYSQEVCYLLK
jgi:hypothetical protein